MPELPEAELCRRALERWSRGHALAEIRVIDPGAVRRELSTRPVAAPLDPPATGARFGDVLRHGKRIGLVVGDRALLVHLGMTGRWRSGEAPPRWARVGILREDGAAIWFVDPRRFGCVVPVAASELASRLREGTGPDALEIDAGGLRAALRGRRGVKVALMDQAVLAGLGNIHAAEALWRARVHPAAPCDALDDGEVARIAAGIAAQLRETIAAEDGSELVYVSEGGPNPFSVYERAGEPCRRCGGAIERIVQGGRSTYLCPRCQAPRAGSATSC